MNGDIWLGPNAVLALDREGYKLFDFNLKDMLEIGKFPGIYKLVLRNIRAGIGELWRTFNLNAQVKDLQRKEIQQWRHTFYRFYLIQSCWILKRFVPEITRNDIVRGPAGVRAQALDMEGNLVDDFIFDQVWSQPRVI